VVATACAPASGLEDFDPPPHPSALSESSARIATMIRRGGLNLIERAD
jgi:hypothetical protein